MARSLVYVYAAGATLTFFGFMHGEQIGIAQTPTVAVTYLIVSGILAGCAKFATVPARAAEDKAEIPGESVPA